ncbi:MAG: EamA family transporter [Ignavibacteriales bacterium]|nr:EamA family transporter [Ignavibacteriales bacterium]
MWLIFAGLNPFSEAFRNLFSKKASLNGVNPYMISWCNNILPILIFLPAFFFIELKLNSKFFFALTMTGTINVFASLLYMRAISEGDISEVVPMLSFTPLFLLLTSPILVGEFPKFWGVVGMVLIVIGSYLLNVNLKSRNILAPLKSLIVNKGTRYMLIVAVIWAVSANFDKISINNSSVIQHILFVNIFVFIGITIVVYFRGKLDFSQINHDRKNLVIMSLFTTTTYIFQMTALSLTLVAYVISLKRVSGMISVFLGHYILDEPHLQERLLGAFLMFCGVIFIVLS